MIIKIFIVIFFILSASLSHAAFKIFLIRVGGDILVESDIARMGRFDLVLGKKHQWDDVSSEGKNTFQLIKESNANDGPEIILYEIAHQIDMDEVDGAWSQEWMTTLGRYTDDRGMTENIEDDGHDLGDGDPWIATYNGGYVYHGDPANGIIELDMSNSDVRAYIAEAYRRDIVGQSWSDYADGIHSDHFFSITNDLRDDNGNSLSGDVPDEYTDGEAYSLGTDSYQYAHVQLMKAITTELNAYGMDFVPHTGYFHDADTNPAFAAYESELATNYVFDEVAGMTNIACSPNNDSVWSTELFLTMLTNDLRVPSIPILYGSRTAHENYLHYGAEYDWYGYDAVWFSLMSFHLIKKDSDFYSFNFYCQDAYNAPGPYDGTSEYWLPEYDDLQAIGSPIGAYYTKTTDGVTFYLRKFTNGYAIVNPSASANSGAITKTDLDITETVYEITKDNMDSTWGSGSDFTEWADGSFVGRRGKFLYFGDVGMQISSGSLSISSGSLSVH